MTIECVQTAIQRDEYIIPVYYYTEALGQPSVELGIELGIASQSGTRRVIGIISPESNVIWSNDPHIQFHQDLWTLAGTSREALFQNTKKPREFVPTVGVFAYEYPALFQAALHILASQPYHSLGVTLELLPHSGQVIYSGRIYELQREIAVLANSCGVAL